MSQYWSPIVHKLKPYVPGEQPKIQGLLKLNTNENPYGPSPKVAEALKDLLHVGESLRLYPDPESERLKAALSESCQLPSDHIFVGNGSDEILAHAFHGLFQHDQPILFPDITYSFYPVYCGLYGIDYRTIPLTESFLIDLDHYPQGNGGVIFPNPNAPTGAALGLNVIEGFLQRNQESVVIVDEAYVDFGSDSTAPLVERYPNLLVVQTFSKSRSLAGLRVGFALGQPALIEALQKIKNSFNSYPINRLSEMGAIAALQDRAYFDQTRTHIMDSRERLIQTLKALGFLVIPSVANFIFVKHQQVNGGDLAVKLREQAIIVRHFKLPRIDSFIRITIGTDEQCERLLSALHKILDR
jgi:histidinol-phosphate aminotransferase